MDFSLDFLALYLAGRSLRGVIRPLRLAAAAAFGAAFSLVSVVCSSGNRLLEIIAFIACALVMCRIAFGQDVLRSVAVFAATDLGLGGLISVMCQGIGRLGFSNVGTPDAPTLMIFALIAGGVSLGYIKLRARFCHEVEVTIELNGQHSLKLLTDSGDLLTEPISGLPVVIVTPRSLGLDSELLPENAGELLLRAIPAESIGGRRLIFGFVTGIVVGKTKKRAVVAPVEADYSGFDGIIPQNLL